MNRSGVKSADTKSRASAHFGAELRAFRARQGWDQQQLADAARVTRQTVSMWETGRTFPYPAQLHLLGQLMGRDVRELTVPASEDVVAVLDDMKAQLDAWYARARARLLAATKGVAPPQLDGLEDDSDAIEATAMRALLKADQAAAAATPAPPAAAPRAASGTRSRRPR